VIIDFHTHLDDAWFDRPMIDRETFFEIMASFPSGVAVCPAEGAN